MESYIRYFVLFVSIISFRSVTSDEALRKFFEDFKDIDSEFDLNEAIEHLNYDDYANITRDIMAKLTADVGPKPKRASNISSAEITKLLENGMKLLDTSGERKLQQMRRAIFIKDQNEQQLKMKNSTTIDNPGGGKIRVKRQGKFAEAAKVDNLKSLRIYLTMFKNLWTRSPSGGRHPLAKEAPKPIVILFKNRIMRFFFPPVGAEKKVA